MVVTIKQSRLAENIIIRPKFLNRTQAVLLVYARAIGSSLSLLLLLKQLFVML